MGQLQETDDKFATTGKESKKAIEKREEVDLELGKSDGKTIIVESKEVSEYSPPPSPSRKRPSLWARTRRRLCTKSISKRQAWYIRALAILGALLTLGVIAFLIWTMLVTTLIHRLRPVLPRNGVTTILNQWHEPNSSVQAQTSWLPNFSSGITPKPIHSHNDYSRDIPLFRALSVGCTGVEADIFSVGDDLLVGHTQRDLRPTRTLQSLYLNPLTNILQSQNKASTRANNSAPTLGVFNDKPDETLVLVLDFKTVPDTTLSLVMTQLEPLRDAGYLTHWDGNQINQGPVTIVGSGLMSERLDLWPNTNGTIFLDAPLTELATNNAYNSSNSLYASSPLAPALHGRVPLYGMKDSQSSIVQSLVQTAQTKGLRARFWATPSWPLGLRDKVWRQLAAQDVGMLNADDVRTAALWNWGFCSVAGLRLC